MSNVIYVAISKESGNVLSGMKGQHAYGDINSLKKSMGQSLSYTAKRNGVKPMDLYSIHEVDLDMILPTEEETE
jgi:hypothetical protein